MRLHDADDNVISILLSGASALQHLVVLTDARRRAHKDSKPADAALFPLGGFKQGLRRGSPLRVATLISHWASSSRAPFLIPKWSTFLPRDRWPDSAPAHLPAPLRAGRESFLRYARSQVAVSDPRAYCGPSRHEALETGRRPAKCAGRGRCPKPSPNRSERLQKGSPLSACQPPLLRGRPPPC